MILRAKHESTPRVSVLMTIYNAGPYLQSAIDSLMTQTFSDWELIAVENGSTDESMKILKKYSDKRVRVFPQEENIGRTPALRFAFKQARGDYIAVLDADDISLSHRLQRQVEFLDHHAEVAVVGSWAQFIDEQGKVTGEFQPPCNETELLDYLGWSNPIPHSSAMYRRGMATAVGGYPEDIFWAQDLAFILALAHRHKIAMLGDYLCQIRVLANSMTRSQKSQILVANEALLLFQRAAELLPLSPEARKLNRRCLAIAEIKLGVATMRDGSILTGAKRVLHGLVLAPSALWGNGAVRRFFGAKY